MGTKEALEILKGMERRKKNKILKHAVLCSKLGSDHERIVYGKVEDLIGMDLSPPAVIVIPGKLHFMEKEFLEMLE